MSREKRLILDENIDNILEKKLESRDFECLRCEEGSIDREVLQFSIENEAPLLTEDDDFKTDIITIEHPGVIFDKYMSRRDPGMVVESIEDLLQKYADDLDNEVWHLSDFYGLRD